MLDDKKLCKQLLKDTFDGRRKWLSLSSNIIPEITLPPSSYPLDKYLLASMPYNWG